jgi:cell division protein FtsW
MVMLYSASMIPDTEKSAGGAHYLLSQLAWCFFGVVFFILFASTDYRRLKQIPPWLLGFSVVLLALVFVPHIGISTHGARRWIGHGSLPHFQPSELAKLALILFLAAYGDRFQRQMGLFKKGLLIPGIIITVVLGLIFIEPDRGCTILLAAVCAVILIVAGVRLSYLIPPVVAAVVGLAISFLHDPMRLGRIMAWLHQDKATMGQGYQGFEAMIALGSGGLFGLGLGNGRQKLGFVPEHHTDFIFSIIGEELGLIATMAVVVLFFLLVICGMAIARRSCDTFGFLLGAGLTFMIGLQAFINVGVVTSILPNKGMPLPFISYGGSNLVLMLVSVGLLVSISRYAAEAKPQKSSNPFEVSLEAQHA